MASFSSHFIDDLLARVSLATVISRTTKLEKRGKSHTGLCPFHKEKTPSFHVDDEKGLYHCFGCEASGNALTFLTQHQGLSFPDAVKDLADTHNIPLPQVSPQQQQHNKTLDRLFDVMEKTTLFFHQNLYADNAESRYALSYLLEERKLTLNTLQHFRIGWAPRDRKTLISHLSQNSCLAEDIQTLGLTSPQNALSFFHSRVMIPVTDSKQRVIAFGGRFLGDAAKAHTGKYINSRTSPLFDKSRVLFNIHTAKKVRNSSQPLIFVEGYMDVILMHQHGFSPCVAALGTASSLHHIQTLWHFSPSPLICFDGDIAGKKATERLLALALPHITAQKSLAFIHLPQNHDPDSLLLAGKKDNLQKLILNPTPLSQKLWLHISSLHPQNTPEHHALIEKETLNITAQIQDTTLQKHLRSHFRNQLWNKKRTHNKTSPFSSPSPSPSLTLLAERKTLLTLLTLIHYPHLLGDFQFLLSHLQHPNPILSRLKNTLLEALWTTSFSSQDELISYLKDHQLDNALTLLRNSNLHLLAPHFSQHLPESASQLLTSIQQRLLIDIQKQEELQKLSQTPPTPSTPSSHD